MTQIWFIAGFIVGVIATCIWVKLKGKGEPTVEEAIEVLKDKGYYVRISVPSLFNKEKD